MSAQPEATQSSTQITKAQARRDVDAALGVVRDPKRFPLIEGFNSYATRLAIRVAWNARYRGKMPEGNVLLAMVPNHMKWAESNLVVQHVRAVAEREGWLRPC